MDKIKANEIVYREDLYPRFEPSQATIQKYSDSTDFLPPIKINQNNILIDGFHRWKAFMLAGINEIPCEVVETKSEKELKMLAYQLNSHHGLQLKTEEKKRFAQEMISEISAEVLAEILGVGKSFVFDWTTNQRDAIKEQRDRKIVDLYLKSWNTQESIADIIGVAKQTISNIIDLSKNSVCGEFGQIFKPVNQ